jgi:hypothetical protein
MKTFTFKIREADWFKRRTPTKNKPIPISVDIPDFKLEANIFCDMVVQYDNGEIKTYMSRVVYNEQFDRWIVDGMHEAVDVIISED